MKKLITDLLKDKNNEYSMRELGTALFVTALLASWLGDLLFNASIPEHMTYTLAALAASGLFGYTFERGKIARK